MIRDGTGSSHGVLTCSGAVVVPLAVDFEGGCRVLSTLECRSLWTRWHVESLSVETCWLPLIARQCEQCSVSAEARAQPHTLVCRDDSHSETASMVSTAPSSNEYESQASSDLGSDDGTDASDASRAATTEAS